MRFATYVDLTDETVKGERYKFFARLGYTLAKAGLPYRDPVFLAETELTGAHHIVVPVASKEDAALFKLFWPADMGDAE